MSSDDDDDMFADTETSAKNPTEEILNAAPVIRGDSLIDSLDDEEGYYQIVLGELINRRYHIYANLGKGVFSGVVKARDGLNNNEDVAIKIIRNNSVMYRAGMKEISILEKLASIDSDARLHTIKLMSHFVHKGHLCLVFECLNLNLRQVLKKFGRDVGLNISAVRSYAAQLMLSLTLLKECRVVHADIKPDNILVTDNHALMKLADFGSAFDVSENELTPYLVSRFYRSPEISTFKLIIVLGFNYDHSLDIWSVACTLFELYTGRILYPGRSNNEMLELFMNLGGKFPKGMLRNGSLVYQHFNPELQFMKQDIDKISGNPVLKVVDIKGPTTTLADMVGGSSKKPEVALFLDLLEKCLKLQPQSRITPKEALQHPFITQRV